MLLTDAPFTLLVVQSTGSQENDLPCCFAALNVPFEMINLLFLQVVVSMVLLHRRFGRYALAVWPTPKIQKKYRIPGVVVALLHCIRSTILVILVSLCTCTFPSIDPRRRCRDYWVNQSTNARVSQFRGRGRVDCQLLVKLMVDPTLNINNAVASYFGSRFQKVQVYQKRHNKKTKRQRKSQTVHAHLSPSVLDKLM